MASAKIIFKKVPYKDGTIPVSIQMISDRRAYPKVLFRVPVKDWDGRKMEVRGTNRHVTKLNQILTRELAAAKEYLLDCILNKLPIDPATFLRADKIGNDIASHLAAKMEAFTNFRTRGKYNTLIARIKEAGLNHQINQVNEAWITAFDIFLKDRGNSPNTRSKYIVTAGSVFTVAKKRGLITINPFESYTKVRTSGKKAKLSMDEFRQIQDARLIDPTLEAVRCMFVFATLARGMRAFDVLTLTWSDIRTGRVIYTAQKGAPGRDGKYFDIEITKAMAEAIRDTNHGDEYVFPFVKDPNEYMVQFNEYYIKHVSSVLAVANGRLKRVAALCGITKVLSMHVARHTFAYLADQANVPLGTTQQLLGHADITTTKIYVESIRESDEMDEAAGKVFG